MHRRRSRLPTRPRIADQLLERDRHPWMISRPEVAVERTLNHPKNPSRDPRSAAQVIDLSAHPGVREEGLVGLHIRFGSLSAENAVAGSV
jgi:hypothetical protein